MLEVRHMALRGIDVSSHQGVINWEEVKSQIDFAIIRCGYAGDLKAYDDKQFIYNATECTRLGIPFGVYLYSYAQNVENAKSEVAHTLRLVKDFKLTYPIFYDVEDPQYQAGLSNELLTEICNTYCSEIEAAGYYVGIYSSLNWFRTKLNSPTLDRYDKWVAQWNSIDQADFTHGMWQYSSDGSIIGITGRVDMDIAYYDYPEIIKSAGLNGFQKPEPEPEPEPEPSCEKLLNTANQKIDELQKENNQLREELKDLQNTEPEKIDAELIFTCSKKATYYLSLDKGDELYYKAGSVDKQNGS